MKTSLQGAMEIIGHEAIVLTRYRDSKGVWTIGVGHTASAGLPDPRVYRGKLTLAEVFDLFRRDLAKFEKRVEKAFKRALKQHEFDAAVSFDFNTGAIDRATWVKSFNAGQRDAAVRQIMNWQRPKELRARRLKEQKLFSTGLYSGDGTAAVYPANDAGRIDWKRGYRVDLASMFASLPTASIPSPYCTTEGATDV